MKVFDKESLPILAAGLLLGLLADLLLRTTAWGINVFIWMAAFIAVAAILEGRRVSGSPSRILLFMLPACFFAGTFAWRDSDSLKIANATAICCIMALAALRNRSGEPAVSRVVEYSYGLVREWLAAPVSYLKTLYQAVTWMRSLERRCAETPLAVMRGLIISIPLLLLFGWLLTSADASFEQLITAIFAFDINELMRTLLWLPLCSVIGGGILLRILTGPETEQFRFEKDGYGLGLIEITIILATLNLLFFAFIGTQFNYFFGGAPVLAGLHDLSMANYARRGFFELVAVTLLVLPLMLILHWLLKKQADRLSFRFRALSGSLVIMLLTVMSSAMHRMYLYQQTFGLTELRLYTSAFMIWLALVFIWFLKTVLFEKRSRFAFGALVTGFIVIAVLDVINPDALIVRINTARHTEQRPVDMHYLSSLSADSVPALVNVLPSLNGTLHHEATAQLVRQLHSINARDWRSWNWGSHIAQGLAGAAPAYPDDGNTRSQGK
jgi:hypothetical protein